MLMELTESEWGPAVSFRHFGLEHRKPTRFASLSLIACTKSSRTSDAPRFLGLLGALRSGHPVDQMVYFVPRITLHVGPIALVEVIAATPHVDEEQRGDRLPYAGVFLFDALVDDLIENLE